MSRDSYITEEQAASLLCPSSRAFGVAKADPFCIGSKCAVWRWRRIMAGDPEWKAGIRAAAEITGEKAPYPKAAQAVADEPHKHGLIPTNGYCGLGGKP